MAILSGKTAIITGSGGGNGQAIALRFAEEGCQLALSDVRLDAVQETGAQCVALGVRATATRTDVTVRAAVETMTEAAWATFGSVDTLVTKAGIFFNAAFDAMTDDQWRCMIDTNLTNVFLVSQAVIRRWIEVERGGATVNLASISNSIAFNARRATARPRLASQQSRAALRWNLAHSESARTAWPLEASRQP